jgi:hypothetical protein
MTPITESGITLTFPDNNFFRFEDCEDYTQLQGIKEMDCCWYDQAMDILYLIELKGWQNHKIEEENDLSFDREKIKEMKEGITKSRIYDLVKKSVDSLLLFVSILLAKPYSTQIQKCSPFTISNQTTIQLLTIVDWKETDTTYIGTLNTAYKTQLKSYMKLLNVKTYLVLTKEQAKRQFSWVS